MNIFNEYCKSKNLYRHNIRKCDLKPLGKKLNLLITPLEYQQCTKKYKIKNADKNYDICVHIVDNHYI